MLETQYRKRLIILGVVLLLVWFIGDVIIGASIQSIKTDEARSASDRARANQFFGGSRYNRNSSVPNSTLVGLEGIRDATIIPLRVAGILSTILLLALSPIPKNLKLSRSKTAPPPSSKLTAGTVFGLIGLLAIGVAQVVAANNLVTVSRPRQFSAAERKMDLEARTMRNPPGHLVPPGENPSNVSIVFGSDRVEMEKVTEIRGDMFIYVWGARLFGGALLFVGLLYAIIGSQVGPPTATLQPKNASPANDNSGNAGE